jgi:hypothetical protein
MEGNFKATPLAWATYTIIILLGVLVMGYSFFLEESFWQNALLNIGSNFVVVTIVFSIFQLFRDKNEKSGDKNYQSNSPDSEKANNTSLVSHKSSIPSSQVHAFKSTKEINDYMYDWISKGGRVVIFTRDMSWASDPRIKELLYHKAAREELSICVPKKIPLTNELQKHGAQILSYESLGYIPQSRFTIINKDRMDANLAVGHRIKDDHVVEEFSIGAHPFFSVANDLVEIITRITADENKKV